MSRKDEQYVVFVINNSLYGIPIQAVSEIIRMQTVNWVPKSREEVLGIIHLRDKVIPVVSLHRSFAVAERQLNSKTRVIVIHSRGKEVGVVVDEVDRVMFLPQEHISPPPHLSENGWITGVYHEQGTIIALLALDVLLGRIDVDQVLV